MKLLFLLSFIFRAASQLVQKVTVIGGAYSVIFRIGDPGQTTTLTTSLSKEFTYVSPFVFKKEYCQSYVSAGMMDITPTMRGEELVDVFTFYYEPKIAVQKMKFVYIRNKTSMFKDSYSLAYKHRNNDIAYSLVHQLKKIGYIDKAAFAFVNHPHNNKEIMYGGIAEIDTINKYKASFDIEANMTHWGCKLSKMFYKIEGSDKEIDIDIGRGNIMRLESEKGSIWAPKKIIEQIRDSFMKDFINNKTCFYNDLTNMAFIACNCKYQKQFSININFVFDDHILYTINKDNFLEDYLGTCFLSIEYSKEYNDSEDQWIFGTILLNQFNTLFDYDSNRVTFYSDTPIEYHMRNFNSNHSTIIRKIYLLVTLSQIGMIIVTFALKVYI